MDFDSPHQNNVIVLSYLQILFLCLLHRLHAIVSEMRGRDEPMVTESAHSGKNKSSPKSRMLNVVLAFLFLLGLCLIVYEADHFFINDARVNTTQLNVPLNSDGGRSLIVPKTS